MNSASRFIDWCNANQGFLSTALTALLVIGTIISLRMASSVRRDALRPLITVEFFDTITLSPARTTLMLLQVSNHGPGLALDVQFSTPSDFRLRTYPGPGRDGFAKDIRSVDVIPHGAYEKLQLTLRASSSAEDYLQRSSAGIVRVTYTDVVGRHFSTVVELSCTGPVLNGFEKDARLVVLSPMKFKREWL